MLNDDYTPMEFVVHVLERFFQKNREEATRIMLHVHRRGVGVCGVYTYEVAETKVTQVMDLGAPEPASFAVHDREGMIPAPRNRFNDVRTGWRRGESSWSPAPGGSDAMAATADPGNLPRSNAFGAGPDLGAF